VVFSLTHPLEDSVESKILADFYEFFAGNIVYVSVEDIAGIAFRISYLQQIAGKDIPKEQLAKLHTLTAGHGKLMRLGAEAFLVNGPSLNTVDELLSQKTIRGALTEISSFLTPSELSDLLAGKENAFLQNIGLLSADNTITIPLLEAFLSIHKIEPNNEAIAYDSATNTIKKGSITISESLTAAEFRLLKFLLDHQEAILDRETIIHAVWRDTATTAGVTDQALDQLIFRLRKKIEQDPNNPIHIQTVKGRGIKFTQ
jgi:DNA-binding winged helix-turn-helix (wHTH) protein